MFTSCLHNQSLPVIPAVSGPQLMPPSCKLQPRGAKQTHERRRREEETRGEEGRTSALSGEAMTMGVPLSDVSLMLR